MLLGIFATTEAIIEAVQLNVVNRMTLQYTHFRLFCDDNKKDETTFTEYFKELIPRFWRREKDEVFRKIKRSLFYALFKRSLEHDEEAQNMEISV